ncbi:MAG: phosphoenolpyruvate--protein phosphotransferase [Treponema sp.]|jgi:phosphotransferase system enzyme I (PtsI)|nr:phosphoenolpyruvate--protein phosphotransferase [Treponema sp.]
MKKLSGISASAGLVIGRALLYVEDEFPEIPRYTLEKGQVEGEWKRLLKALPEASEEIKNLRDQARVEISKEQVDIFEAHLLMLEDPIFLDQIKASLESRLENVEWVVWDIASGMSRKLAASPDLYLRERANDITDVSRRLISRLLAVTKFSLADLEEDVILVARDLMPSDVLTMNRERVKAIVMDQGSRTSHTAILARAFGIPAVLGLSSATKEICNGDSLAVDGGLGEVMVNPSGKTLTKYRRYIERYQKEEDDLTALQSLPAETTDGHRVSLKANIEIPEEAKRALRYGAEGIGLYRSEFLFLAPGKAACEEEQYLAYRKVLRAMGKRPVTIRTLDLGGDKIIPGFQTGNEKNPLLGWRAIRFCLALPEMFKIQLRAILRASVEGNVRIMFPMISGLEELEQALALWEDAKDECRRLKQPFAERIEAGCMIEIPSAVMTADILARRSDFFSIGTNDLVQYTLAVDRGNERVNYLAQPTHPAVLRFLKQVIDAAHAGGIKAAMCGELAGDPSYTPLLLGLGLDEFSMTASSIPQVKRIIRGAALRDCCCLVDKALNCSSYHQAAALATEWLAERFPT